MTVFSFCFFFCSMYTQNYFKTYILRNMIKAKLLIHLLYFILKLMLLIYDKYSINIFCIVSLLFTLNSLRFFFSSNFILFLCFKVVIIFMVYFLFVFLLCHI